MVARRDRYVADVAPERYAELRRHLDQLEPAADTETAFQHAQLYMKVTDKKPFVDHARAAENLRITAPPEPDMVFASVGSYLDRWYGDDYRSIGFTFDHGTFDSITVPPPAPEWYERPFGQVDADQFLLDLRGHVPGSVREWLRAPARTRGFLDHVPPYESFMSGGALGLWFDVIIHRQEITAAASL